MLQIFKSDLKKYRKYSGGKSYARLFLTQQGLWAIFVYRINHQIYVSGFPKILKTPLLLVGLLFQKLIEIIAGISLPHSAKIGREFYIGHFGGIIINSKAIIGNNCNISQGVTIGISGRGAKRGVPIIGHNVYIGANAVVAGAISIGDNVLIAANSLVVDSVEDGVTVVGVPAKKINDRSSEDYIL